MNAYHFSTIAVILAVLVGCATGPVPVYRTDPGVQTVPYVAQAAVYPPQSCTPPDWKEGEEWAQKANAGAGSTTTGSVERRFRAEKGGQSYFYDSQGNCVYTTDSNARSRRGN